MSSVVRRWRDRGARSLPTFGAVCALAGIVSCAHAAEGSRALAPASAFVQAGYGDQRANAFVTGLTWYLPWRFDFQIGTLAVYAEGAIGRWHAEGRHGGATTWPTQLGATPVLRLFPSFSRQWFVEIGVGANYIVPLFNTGEKRFSTEFNFGDLFAIGRRMGASEISIRIEHFSNAGIDHPNPGENFLQMRYAHAL